MRFRLLASAFIFFSCSLLAHADTVTDNITEFIAGRNNLLFVLNYTLTFNLSVNSEGSFGYTSVGLTYDGGTFLGAAIPYEQAFSYPIQYKYNHLNDELEIETNGFTDGYGYLIYMVGTQTPNPTGSEFQITDPSNTLVDRPDPSVLGIYIEGVTVTQVAATPEPSSLVLLGTGLLGVVGVARRRMSA